MHLLRLAAALCLLPALHAQSTWIVSATPGPDVDFADLPAAVAAAQPGDEIVLWPGQYTPVTISIGVTLRGTPGAGLAAGTLRISQLPAGQQAIIRDIDLSSVATLTTATRIRIEDCQGLTHLENLDIRLQTTGGFFLPPTCVGVTSNPSTQGNTRVTMMDCRLSGAIGVSLGFFSSAHLTNCDVQAMGTNSPVVSGGGAPALTTSPGATLTINGGTYKGGDAVSTGSSPTPSAPAISGTGVVRIGGVGTILQAGDPGGISPAGPVADQGTVIPLPQGSPSWFIDPGVELRPAAGAPALRGDIQIRPVAAATPIPAQNPNRTSLEVSGPPQAMWVLFCADPFGPLLTEIGVLWLLPGSETIVRMGRLNAHGKALVKLPVRRAGMPQVRYAQPIVFTGTGAALGVPTILLYD